MKYCTKCGAQLSDDSNFCHACGAQEGSVPAQTITYTQNCDDSEQKSFLDSFFNMLRWERNFWMISAIIYLVGTVMFVLCSIMFLAIGKHLPVELMSNEDITLIFGAGFYFFFALFAYLPITIINFVMTKKVRKYRDMVNHDLETVVNRCGNVGIIVLGALFNQLALIFIIINFVRVKANKKLIEQIINKQKTGV